MRRLGLVARFAIFSALLIGVLGVVLARSIESGIKHRNLESARNSAVLVSRLGVQSRLTPGQLARGLSPAEIIDLDRALRSGFGREVSRIKIWNADRRIVYSDDQFLIGRRFPTNAEVEEALEGKTESEISSLTGEENVQDRGTDDKLLEVYTPIQFATNAKPAGAFEIYLPYAPIAAGIHDDVMHLWALLIAGLALLWAALFRIVLSAARRLRSQMERNEHQSSHDPLTELANRRASTSRRRPRCARPSAAAGASRCC